MFKFSNQQMALIVNRLARSLPADPNRTEKELKTIAEIMVLTGANPYQNEISITRFGGKSQFMLSWTYYVRVARGIDEFSVDFEVGEYSDGVYASAYLLRDASIEKMEKLVTRCGLDPAQALNIVTTVGQGRVDPSEMKGRPPVGSTWANKAEKRALVHAIRRAYPLPGIDADTPWPSPELEIKKTEDQNGFHSE